MASPSTYTLWKHNDKAAKMTYSITFRPGWTPTMLAESRQHYVAACQAARSGQRTIESLDHMAYINLSSGPIVQIFGDVDVLVAPGITRKVTINCFDENTSGQELLDELWAIVDALTAIEAVATLEVATTPQPATLRITTQDELNAYVEKHPYDDVTDMPNIKLRPSRQRRNDYDDPIAGDDN